ncbi:serine hydrolase [Sulfitobacter sp. HI0082]|nr:serine hydrolase [Sulfitobacter sp. HI0082]KZZ27863.1 serine hydrolase [Sulfitobacter sp. HI0082]
MAIMVGFPPKSEDRATLANWRTAPYCSWAFHHVREIVPSANIANDPGNIWELEQGSLDLSGANLKAAVTGMQNDALVILHKGRIVHESYRNGMGRHDPHILMSVSKSMLGLLAGSLVESGELNPSAQLTHYIPELAGTAYEGATVRDALDMRVGVKFDEDYFVTEGPIIAYRWAANWNPVPEGRTPHDLRSFQSLLTEPDGPHNDRFHYASPVTDLMAWVLERASGMRYADLMSERLWQPMGAEDAGYLTVDRIGGPRAAGGMCVTARDLARVGQLILQKGARDGRQVIPESWIDDIINNGDRDAWDRGDFAIKYGETDTVYRSKWYVIGQDEPLINARGIHGQSLFVDPGRDLVIAWMSSENDPVSDDWKDHIQASVARIRAAVD